MRVGQDWYGSTSNSDWMKSSYSVVDAKPITYFKNITIFKVLLTPNFS